MIPPCSGPERARVLRPGLELEGHAPRLRGDHAHADQVATGRREPRPRRSAAGARASRQQHGADHVAALHRRERLLQPSSGAVRVTMPARSSLPSSAHCARRGKSSCGRWSPPCETRIARRLANSRGRSSSTFSPPARARSGRTCRPSSRDRAPARRSSGARRRRRRSRRAPAPCASRRTASPARASARRGRSRGSPTRRRCARPGSPRGRPRRSRSPRRALPPTPSPSRAPTSRRSRPRSRSGTPARRAARAAPSPRRPPGRPCASRTCRCAAPASAHCRRRAAGGRRSGRLLHWRGSPRRHIAHRRRPSSSRARRGRRARGRRRRRRPPRSSRRPRGRAAPGTRGPSRPPRSRAGRCGRRRSPRCGRAPRPARARSTVISSSATAPGSPRTTPCVSHERSRSRIEWPPASARFRSISAIRFWISSSTPALPADRERVGVRPAEQHRVGAERHRLQHVGRAADAAVHQHDRVGQRVAHLDERVERARPRRRPGGRRGSRRSRRRRRAASASCASSAVSTPLTRIGSVVCPRSQSRSSHVSPRFGNVASIVAAAVSRSSSGRLVEPREEDRVAEVLAAALAA